MKMIRTVYCCTYTKNNNGLPRHSPLFATEQGARAYAKQLITQGYWGVIARCSEWKQDDAHYAWCVDSGEQAIEMLGYF
jgi:hypothetical protein